MPFWPRNLDSEHQAWPGVLPPAAPLEFFGQIANQSILSGSVLSIPLAPYWRYGITPYTWTLLSGSLPAWLSLDRSTGLLSGTAPGAAEAAVQVQFRATDSINSTADSNAFAITVGDLVLFVSGDGTNGQATFIDQSPYGRAISTNGNVIVSTAQSKWEPSSIYFDKVSNAWLRAEYTAATALGSGDFTMECWVRCSEDLIQGLFGPGDQASIQGFVVKRGFNGTRLVLRVNGVDVVVSGAGTFNKNVWHFVSLQRSGNTLSLYLNGSLVGTASYSHVVPAVPLYLGAEIPSEPGAAGDGNWFLGHIEQFRVIRGLTLGAHVPSGPF